MLEELTDRRYMHDCNGKVRHYTIGAAESHIQALRNRTDCREPETLHWYWCPFGAEIFAPHIHVGHSGKEKE